MYLVEESFGETDSYADKKKELMGRAWKSSAEVKQYDSRQLFRGGFVVCAVFVWFFLGAVGIGVTRCSVKVAYSSSCVNVDDVI